MLGVTVPWLLRRDDRDSERLLRFMSGPGHVPSSRLVEWMTLVARTCRTTGAPAPHAPALVAGWRGGNVRVAVGDHDVFFPVGRLREATRAGLGTDPTVVERAGHLLGDENPLCVKDLVAEVLDAPRS
jgi:hypothetical protein